MIHELSFHGASYRYDDGEVNPVSCNGEFADETEIREKYWNVRPGEMVIDVGAGWGSYTLSALALGALVWAFEPIQKVAAELIKNIALNDFAASCSVMTDVLSDKNLPPQPFTGSIAVPGLEPVFNEAPHYTLDSFKGIQSPDWLKIDAEGAEYLIVKGAREVLTKYKPNLVIELHIGVHHLDRYIRTEHVPQRLMDLLGELGYRVEVVPYNVRAYYIAVR